MGRFGGPLRAGSPSPSSVNRPAPAYSHENKSPCCHHPAGFRPARRRSRRCPGGAERACADPGTGTRGRAKPLHGRYLARHRLRRRKHLGRLSPQRPPARHRRLGVGIHQRIPRRPRDHRSLGVAQLHGEFRDGHQCVAARPARPEPVDQRRESPQPHDGPRSRGEPGHGLFHEHHEHGSLPRRAV